MSITTTELVNLKEEEKIDELRIKAFLVTSKENMEAYYKAASRYFQQRHDRRLEASYIVDKDKQYEK